MIGDCSKHRKRDMETETIQNKEIFHKHFRPR